MGFADKRLVFGGAGPGTPWGTLGEITARALAPHGCNVRIDPEASRGRCPGLVCAYTPEIAALVEASVLLNLRFLPLPDGLIQTLCSDYGGEPGFIPYRLLRGVEAPVPSVYRPWQLIFGRDDNL